MSHSKVIFVILLASYISLQAHSKDVASLNRTRRDSISEKGTMLAMQAAGTALEVMQEGAAVQDSRKTGINMFGMKAGAGYDAQVGFGDAVKGSESDDDSDERRRRKRRSPCGKSNRMRTTQMPNDASEIDENRRRKRQSAVKDSDNVVPNGEDPNEKRSTVFRRMAEIWSDVVKRVTSWFDEADRKLQ